MMTVFQARHIELDAVNRRDPLDAWDIPAIAEHYESFIDRWGPLLPRIRSRHVSGAEAVKARTQVMDTYRLFPVLDPQLPLSLLPAGWLRDPARELFTAVYDGLAEAAQAHVRSVTGQFAHGAPPDVQAHTVADLLAGLHPAGPRELLDRGNPRCHYHQRI
jgi:phenylacetic acid degradation operon negative regulatory protein